MPKNPMLRLILNRRRLILAGAALRRWGNRAVENAAFADGGTLSNRKSFLPRPNAASLAIIVVALLSSTYSLADSTADTYKAHCSACHGAHGAGDTMIGKNLKLRPLTSPEVQKQSDDELATIIGKGKNRMPSFDRRLSQQQIRELVNYIRALKN